MKKITERMLDELRSAVSGELSAKRFRHVAAVEEMAERLAALYCPEQTYQLRAAALLHDVTKEWSTDDQLRFLREHGQETGEEDRLAHKTLHARTAALLIGERFPEWDDPVITSAVRWHTTGRAGMTLTEQLLYLADYIDLSRTFDDCVRLRHFFFDAEPEKLDATGRNRLLRNTLILSYDMTVRTLLEDGLPVAEDTIRARNELLVQAAEDRENAEG